MNQSCGAIAAITLFGDEIAVTADKSVTLKDMFRTAFAYISDAAGVAAEWIKSVWNTAIDWVGWRRSLEFMKKFKRFQRNLMRTC